MNWTIVDSLSNGILLFFIVGIPVFALYRKVDVFNVFLLGAKEGFQVALHIIPPLIALFVAIGMFRAAGGFALLEQGLRPILDCIHFPHEVIGILLTRPFSGSATNALLAELAHQYGGGSYIAHLAATISGSTETTFYIIAVYFGVVAIRKTRYAIPVGLFADLVGVIAATIVTYYIFQH